MPDAIHPIMMFVDESYLDGPNGRTGTIQSIVTLSHKHYKIIARLATLLLSELPKTKRKEFKGEDVNSKTKSTFKKFVGLFRNMAAFNAYRYDLKSVFTIDSVKNDSGKDLDWVRREVEVVLDDAGLSGHAELTEAFSIQLNWFIDHFPAVSRNGFSNPFYVIFDNRANNAQLMLRSTDGTRQVETVFTEAAKRVLSKTDIKVPNLQLFSYRFSHKEIGLQAADLFSHLLFNFLKSELGYENRKTRIKAGLMQELIPSIHIGETDLADFQLAVMAEQEVPVLLNKSKSLQFHLDAPSEEEVEQLFGRPIESYQAR